MEPRFGRDLGDVRVHTGAQAAASARAIQARAYTVGQDVVFAEGQFTPATSGGRELLAHELAHTVQQRGGSGSRPIDSPHSDHERTARSAARDITAGQHLQSPLPPAAIGLSRSPDDERAKAVAEAEAVLKKMEEDEAETAKKEAEDEARAERRREEILHPSHVAHQTRSEVRSREDDRRADLHTTRPAERRKRSPKPKPSSRNGKKKRNWTPTQSRHRRKQTRRRGRRCSSRRHGRCMTTRLSGIASDWKTEIQEIDAREDAGGPGILGTVGT